MYLEISYNGDLLLELPIEKAGKKLKTVLEDLYHKHKEDYDPDSELTPQEWVTDLTIAAVYTDD